MPDTLVYYLEPKSTWRSVSIQLFESFWVAKVIQWKIFPSKALGKRSLILRLSGYGLLRRIVPGQPQALEIHRRTVLRNIGGARSSREEHRARYFTQAPSTQAKASLRLRQTESKNANLRTQTCDGWPNALGSSRRSEKSCKKINFIAALPALILWVKTILKVCESSQQFPTCCWTFTHTNLSLPTPVGQHLFVAWRPLTFRQLSLGNQTVKIVRQFACEFELGQSECYRRYAQILANKNHKLPQVFILTVFLRLCLLYLEQVYWSQHNAGLFL